MGADHSIFGFRHGIAVAQVALFAASLAIGVYFYGLERLGIPRRNGWFCVGVFSVFRLVGAGCMLGTLANDDDSVWAGVFVCESFGMVLIVFLLLELMQRANNAVPTIDPRAFYIPQLLTWADLGLAIAGFASAARRENEHPLAPTSLTRASFGLFTALYLWIAGMAYLLSFGRRAQRRRDNGQLSSSGEGEGEVYQSQSQNQGQGEGYNKFPRDERRALGCAVVCLPLLAVRTAYSLVFQITGDMAWNAVKGRPAPYLLMTFLPELAIIYACVLTIMRIAPPPPPKEEKNKEKEGAAEKQDKEQTTAKGIILSWLWPSRWQQRRVGGGGYSEYFSPQVDGGEVRGSRPRRLDEESISLVPSRR
ncbi:hypothetical protein PG997_012508 [Apiospora hydei]|uniref:DUF7702 domain-containing protein n=1 Tax=Apiospora hydei TaxID=1337664 RepID=A0ABR1V3K1_9PEZI